ncbi:unnamed protein product [Polarella glacialis]|uniref:Uncharacterized protein n=1 Tax=Polarella glacialis TaxID=89957 RepID=A0A813H1M3_POLGL|nr:unnamed protein product [Polarella glacialis]
MSIGYDEHPAVNVVELVGKVVWPNIELDIAKLDFGTVLNDTSRKLEVRMTNPTVLQVAYHWCFALSGGRQSDEASNPRTPAAALPSPMMDSKSSNIQARTTGNSGMNSQGVTFTDDSGGSPAGTASGWALGASPGSVSSEIGASQDLAELNQVFDILPIFGKLEPGETQVATFTYDGMRDRSFKAIAVCMVDGGPEYEVSLRGNAAPCKYSLDKNELDFNDIPFTEVGEQELFLANRGQVPANFNFNMSGVSRSFVVDIVPSHGIMKPEEKLKVIVRFRAGIPDLVEEKVLVEVAHFEPQVLIVRGQGTFPGIVLNLPRKDDTSGTMETMEAANPISPRQAGRAATSPSHTRRGKLDDGEPPSPRSAATEGNLAGMASMKDTQQSLAMTKMSTMRGPDIPDLELEVEVDRHYLCEVLLNGPGVTPPTPGAPERPQLTRSNSMSPSKKSKAGKKDLIEQPTVTAAYYVCDFGHIPLGNVCKRTVDVYNTCSEPVTLTIDKKALKEMGFLIEPENIKPVQPGKALKLEVSATRAKEESETTVELEWNLPVKGGPNYKVKLVADWVLPELVLSSESIDFGRIIIGQRKRVIVEFHNEKKVPVDWVFAKPKDKYGQDLSPNELVFDLSPAGVVMPGEKQYATAIFSPQAAQAYTSVLHLRIRDNQKRKSINVVGRGDVMRLDVRPSLSYNLGPIMPKNSGCSTEFWLCNPTDYPIEVYSLDFDQKYLDEERALADFDGFETGFCEMPVRQPGDGIWKAVASRVLDVRHGLLFYCFGLAEKEAEAAAKLSLQNTQGVTEGEPTAEGTALLALKAAAQEKDEEVMDGSPYPYRVPDGKRVNAIIAGPPKSGMSTLALRLSKEDKRKVITSIDEIFTWAAEHDGFLHSDWAARSIVKRIKEGNVPSMSEAAHLLRRRVELPDCNAGVIIDGLQSDFLDAEQVTDAVLEAFSGDKVVLMTVALPAQEVQEEEDLSVAAPPDFSEPQADNPDPAAPVKPPPPSLAGSAMSKLYEELQTALLAHIEELKAAMPEMEAAKKAAEEALTEAGARAEAVAASKTAAAAEAAAAAAEAAAAAGLSPLDPSSAEYPAEAFDGEVDSETAEVLAAKAEEAQADLASCECVIAQASVGWKPPEVPVDPAVAAAAAAEAAAAPKAKAKAAPAKGAPPPVEVAEPTEPVADPAVEQLVKLYNEQRTAALTVVERCNTRARSEEEERQRDQDRRKVSRKAAQLAASVAKRGQSTGSRNAPPPEVEPVVDFEPKMDKYLPPADVLTLELTPAPFDLLLEPSREALPLPLIPANSPLPLSTIRQIVSLPNARPERSPPVNFSILTPVPAVSNPIRIASRAGSKASEVTVADQTRWIIEPQSEQRLLVHFDSEEVASYSTVLQFEVVGDVASAPTTIGVSGVAALPGINSDPRLIFSRRKKKRPEAGYAVKAFVTSLGVYDFGPLLAGRDPSSRNPAPVVPTDEAGDEVGAGDSGVDSDGQEMNQDPIPPREMTAVSTHVMRHAESIRITNDSLFPANVRLGLASSGGDFEHADEVTKGPSSFIIEPENIRLGVGEQADVKIWCFPPDKGLYKDRFVARIEHNPEPVVFKLCALGAVPAISVDNQNVDFGRLMMNIRAEDQKVRVKNDSAVPVRWQLLCSDSKVVEADPPADKEPPEEGHEPKMPDEFMLDPKEGLLSPGEVRDVRISFRATRPASFKFGLRLEARDAEGLNGWQEAGKVAVGAETFAVDAAVEPDPREVALDFGTVLVHTSAQRTFDIVNRGRFPVRFELAVRRALRELLAINQHKDELQPGERRTITATCTPGRVFEASGERDGIAIFDTLSGESVDHRIPPIRVGVTAVYNTFQVTPPRGLNFGPVEKGETQTRTFTVRNNGIFAFDWCLFNYADLPTFGEDGKPPPPPACVNAGPFAVKPTSGKLQPDEDVQVNVTFEAQGDEDYDSKIAVWVDGVQGENDGRPLTAGQPVAGTSTYLLTGQSCVPGINTVDLQTVFEEQFFASTLEDAIAIAGRADVRVFSEADQIFHFGPVLASGGAGVAASTPASPSGAFTAELTQPGVTEFLRLSNPKAIPCKIQLHIKPREGGDTKAGNEIVFEVEPQELVIPPHESRQIAVSFKPTHLANFGAVLEAVVPQGTDPNTNYLSFELRGDGAVPSISLQGPRLFGDEGGELVMGKLTLGKTHEVRMTLRNGGLLPATARVECMRSEHFTVTCASTVALNKGEQRTFQVRFHPRSVGKVQTDLRIRTLGNPFEDVVIQLKGEGHSAEVCWDLAEARLPPIRTSAAVVEDSAHAPAPDELELREVAVGQEISVTFQLNNGSKQPLRFAFPEQMPEPFGQQLQVEPRTGFIDPQSKQAITLIFRPTDKLQASGVYVPCNMVNVTFAEESPAEGDVATEPPVEPQYQVIEGTQLELPLMVSAVADTPAIECDVEEINFLPTLMLGSKVWRFMIKNPSIISIPFEWKMQGRNSSAYTVSPMHGRVAAQGEQEIEVHFAPMEVENFDCQLLCSSQMITAKPVLRLPVTGTALRPWCHFELPGSDYRSRRQSNAPLDPKYQIVEIVSLGTHVKNTKRFYVSNPTAEPIDFLWQQEQPVFSSARPESADDDAFKCLTRKGTILPSKKFEMTFEFSPQNSNTKESFWSFVLLGPKVEEHFLIAGTVKEPRVGMDMACINFGERLLSGMASETVRLVNKEHIPFSFQIDPASFQQEGQLQALSISPMSGVVGPDSDISITVHFKPMEELPFNFNVVCNIKRKKEPVVLNVKGIGYKIHASLAIEEPSGRRLINSGVTEVLDMGLLQVHEQRELTLYLKNDSKRNFNFRVQMLMGANRRPKPIGAFERPPYISISNTQGVAPHHEETVIGFKYCPRDAHMLEGSILQVAIPAGPVEETFSIALTGGAKRSRVDFSFLSHDFGPCFIARGGATMAGEPFSQTEDTKYERVCIVATNRDDSDCLISTTFQREPWLDVQLNSAMIEAGGSLRIPIVFSPRDVCEYMQRIEFVVNDYTRMHVDVRGRGCPLKLELTDSEMQNIDFGITRGNEPVSRTVRLINRSPRPVTFELGDEKGELAERSVTWTPGHPTTLRPRETADVELRFTPTYRIAPFRLPLIAKCEHGVEVRLLHIAGTCHATEMRLSEHSVFFGDVVVGSQATRTVRLHNFGDLGAKFRFEIGAKYSKIFSVTPSEGFVRPSEDILLTLAFHPTYERIQEFKRADGKKRGGKTPGADAKAGLDVRDIRCILDGHEPLMLEASGKCVVQPGETKSLEFTTEVRTKTQNSFLLENTTDSDWKVQPQVATQEPAGTNYFSCEREIIVPAGKSVPVQVYYMPLTMTGAEEESVSPSHGKRCIVHKGTVFVGTPDGNAVGYSLEGTASAPKVRDRMEVEVPCKKKHTQAVPVKNWLHERQRFDVKVELVEPAPGTPQSQGINLQGVGTLDLPPGLEREYKFSVYAYHEGSALVRVNLRSQETGEFMMLEAGSRPNSHVILV